jgi:hypothetical protein
VAFLVMDLRDADGRISAARFLSGYLERPAITERRPDPPVLCRVPRDGPGEGRVHAREPDRRGRAGGKIANTRNTCPSLQRCANRLPPGHRHHARASQDQADHRRRRWLSTRRHPHSGPTV